MEGTVGIIAPADGAFLGSGSLPALLTTFRWKTPPSVGRSKGGEVPPASPPAFFDCRWLKRARPIALHEGHECRLFEVPAVQAVNSVKELQIEKRHQNHKFTSAPNFSKFVKWGAEMVYELRKVGTSRAMMVES